MLIMEQKPEKMADRRWKVRKKLEEPVDNPITWL